MPTPKPTIHIRTLEVADFSFVRDLAALQPNFTIPPPYVLWLLLKIKGDVCLLAEDENRVPLAYLLAVPIDEPSESFYVWQLVATETGGSTDAIENLLISLRTTTQSVKAQSLVFSAFAGTSSYRAIQRIAWKVFKAKPTLTSTLPDIVAPGESEYTLKLL